MYYSDLAKQKITNAIHRQFDNPEELGQKLMAVYDDEVKDILREHLKEQGFHKGINVNNILSYILVRVLNKSSDSHWLDIVDVESGRDLSDPTEVEELEKDDNAIMNIIVTHLDESCEVEINMPDSTELLVVYPTVEFLSERIESHLESLDQTLLLREIMGATDVEEIEPIIRTKAIENGFPQDEVDDKMKSFTGNGRPFKYQFKNARITSDALTLAEKYIGKANEVSTSSFLRYHLINEMIRDGYITYEIEVLDEPTDM